MSIDQEDNYSADEMLANQSMEEDKHYYVDQQDFEHSYHEERRQPRANYYGDADFPRGARGGNQSYYN